MFLCWWSCGYRVCHQSTGANRSEFSSTASSVWYHLWSGAPGPTVMWTCINIQIQSWRCHTWDEIQTTCPPRLRKLTRVEWHNMRCIYSQAQESGGPQSVYERFVWAQRGELVHTENRVLGWKVCGVYASENRREWLIFWLFCLSFLAFESEWQRLQVSLCISVSFKR